VLAGPVAAVVLLAGCAGGGSDAAAGAPDGPRALVVGLTRLGVDCTDVTATQSTTLPYTAIACVGVHLDWVTDRDRYAALVAADCAAADTARAAADPTVVVTGPDWVLRGADRATADGWPRRVTPAAAAQALGGTAVTTAEYCRRVGA